MHSKRKALSLEASLTGLGDVVILSSWTFKGDMTSC